MMLFRFIADTLKIKDKVTKKTQTYCPVKYNYEDHDSHINYDSHFVTALMQKVILSIVVLALLKKSSRLCRISHFSFYLCIRNFIL